MNHINKSLKIFSIIAGLSRQEVLGLAKAGGAATSLNAVESWYYKDEHINFRPISAQQLHAILAAYLEYYVPHGVSTREKPPYLQQKKFPAE